MDARIKLILFFILFLPATTLAAVKYDGTGDGHNITDPNVGATTTTVCFWVKTAAFTDGETIAYYGNGPDSSAGRGWSVEENNIDASSGKIKLVMFNGASGFAMQTPTLSINTWYHLCFVGQGSPDSLVYVNATDGLSDATNDTDAYTAASSTDDFNVGQTMPARTGAGANDSDDYVAHFGYWNTALSGASIATLADKSTCPTAVSASNLKVFLTLDSAGSVTDTSSNAFTVVENGNPTTDAGPGSLPCGAASSSQVLLLHASGSDE